VPDTVQPRQCQFIGVLLRDKCVNFVLNTLYAFRSVLLASFMIVPSKLLHALASAGCASSFILVVWLLIHELAFLSVAFFSSFCCKLFRVRLLSAHTLQPPKCLAVLSGFAQDSPDFLLPHRVRVAPGSSASIATGQRVELPYQLNCKRGNCTVLLLPRVTGCTHIHTQAVGFGVTDM
jgi:hypothetical protein